MLNVKSSQKQLVRYERALKELEEASRQYAGTTYERFSHQEARANAIVTVSNLGVPRATVAKLTGLTAGRVQQILDDTGGAGAKGDDWADPELRRLVGDAIAARPIPSVGVGLRRESTLGPHLGRGYGGAIRLTGDLAQNRAAVVEALEHLAERVRSGRLDDVFSLTPEERDLVERRVVEQPA
jgi:hypothetical protein